MALTNTATVSYNGYTFNVQSRTQINSTPVYDRSGRTVTQTEYTLTVTSKVTEGASQNSRSKPSGPHWKGPAASSW